ncbi:hypothetical protein RFI_32181 [Reticulomyxa filosa]|uniref:Uncharacterized protein n=1 Tax=Reticulomyxa filosa TaxID=46433 RepID=X6LWV2_RETFI|nr:hypothetical protein RFI_32181 [Reticulomyxa filosa]|eukprot:ETO05215.1 hypothetical protein RFI_32181 [Reticulomyxa filosa]
MSNQTFQRLKNLPIPFQHAQCVLHKHELLICGGYKQRACYSYHILKNEYKFICQYISHIQLDGHCVVKLVDNKKDKNQVILLSFGGAPYFKRHTLIMKYVSVWSKKSNKSNELNNYNKWTRFTDNYGNPIMIDRGYEDYRGARAVIGGVNNNLLFITCRDKYISVFDLNTFQFIKHDILPIENEIYYYCFVSNAENGQGQEMIKTNKQNYQMLLFHKNIGLSIEYDEDKNNFQFHQLPVCDDIALFCEYAYVCINDIIFIQFEKTKWMTFENTLPTRLFNCTAILSEEDNHIHIIGGQNNKFATVSTHIKTKMRVWDSSLLVMIYLFSKKEIKFTIQHWVRILKIKLGWIDEFDKIITKYIR